MRHLARLVSVSLGLFVCLSSAEGGTRRHDRDDSLYTSLALETQFDPVGQAFYGGGGFNNGILIAPNWVLTAAHIGTPASFSVGGNSYPIDQRIAHFNWSDQTQDLGGGWDIALLRLSTPVGNVTPASIYTGSSELDQLATYVGFGKTGTGLTGDIEPAGTKRAGQNMIDAFAVGVGFNDVILTRNPTPPPSPADRRIMISDFDHPTDPSFNVQPSPSPVPVNLEYNIAENDSGGGVFIQVGNDWFLVGVNSFVFNPNGGPIGEYGDAMGFTRVSEFDDWIGSITSIPEPSTCALIGTVSLVSLIYRRSRRGGAASKA